MAENLPDPMFFYVQHAGGMMSLFRDEDKASDCAERSCGPRPYSALFTADQMRAYAADAVKAEREACAELCDAKAREYMNLENKVGGGRFERMACGAENCADAIRARKENHG